MKTKARILTLLLALITMMSPFVNVANAADYKSTHTASDSYATVTKSAKWTNEAEGEAEITINVTTQKPNTVLLTNADIIYVLDKSNSMGKDVGTSYSTVRNTIRDQLLYFVTGDYANAGNRVAFATFSSNLFVYTGGTKTTIRYKNDKGKDLTATGQVPNAETAKKYFENGVTKANASSKVKFYSTKNEVEKIFTALNSHGDGENSNFDLALSYVRYLIDNRTGEEKNRQTYIIFITEGEPFPNSDYYRNMWGDHDKWPRPSDYAANVNHTKIASAIRASGAQMYAIMLNRAHKKVDKELWAEITSGSKNDNSHLYYTLDESKAIKDQIIAFNNTIKSQIQQGKTASSSMVLTDYIETEYFKFDGSTADVVCTASRGTVSIDPSTGKVTWNLGSNLPYGTSGTLKIKIKLKDLNTEGWVNTNNDDPKDDDCVFEHDEGEVPVPTPWLERELPKYTVTEKWLDKATDKEIVASKSKEVKKNDTYTVDRKDLTNYEYKYDSSVPTDSVLTITQDTTIIHYYNKVPMYDVIEKYVDKQTGEEIAARRESGVEKGEQYQPVVKNIDGYKYDYSNPTAKEITVDDDITVTHYYDKIYDVTIKHIDDEKSTTAKQVIIDTTSIENIIRNTTWPVDGTIESKYAIVSDKDPNIVQRHFGQEYAGYYLDEDNIKINGTKYKLEDLPGKLTMNEDKVIEFHYKRKDATLIIRNHIIEKVGDVLNPGTTQTAQKENNVKVEQSYNVKKSDLVDDTTKNAGYVGYNVTIGNTPEIYTRDDISGIFEKNSGQTASFKITQQENANGKKYYPSEVYVDFMYMEQKYSLNVKYVDQDGNQITDDEAKITLTPSEGSPYSDLVPATDTYNSGTVVTPSGVPTTITLPDGREYELQGRKDGQDINASITMDGNKELVYEYKLQTIPVIIHYKDKINNEPIADDYGPIQVPPNQTTPAVEKNIPDEYEFINRDDGKDRTEDIGPIVPGGKTEYTFYYWKAEEDSENPDDGLPVVSYPKATAENNREKDDKAAVLLGEYVTITIPNDGYHEQMDGLGVTEPDGGWNYVYGQVEYLRCTCDVYYNNTLYTEGTAIKIAERADIEDGDVEVDLFIPEWVKEGTHTVAVVVGSKNNGFDGLDYTQEWNELYAETAAIGETQIEVLGKVYDFTITNLIEDNYWEGSLYDVETEYKANLTPTVSTIGTLPIGQGTTTQQNQKYNHGIALGSTFFFNVNTLGVKNKVISIKPTFKYVAAGTTEVKDVDLYIEVDGKYEKLTDTDGQVIQTQLNNDYKKENTKLGFEMSYAFGIAGFEDLKTNASYDLVTGSRLRIDKQQRVPFADYIAEKLADSSINNNVKQIYNNMTDEQKEDLFNSACHWYGEYRLPSSTKVMEKGATPGKGTEYKDGFIIVLFEIITQDTEDEVAHDDETHKYLVYNEQIVGDQWDNEGGVATGETITLTMPRLTNIGTKEVNLIVENGVYPVAIYDVSVRANGKYEAAGTH